MIIVGRLGVVQLSRKVAPYATVFREYNKQYIV